MKNKGFTLLEAIIAMSVLMLAIAVVFYGYISVAKIFTEEMADTDIMIETTRPIEQMTKELRNSLQIISSTSHSVTFWHSDTNDNGTMEAGETISYSWAGTPGGDLIKTVSSDAFIVANSVRDFTLTYTTSLGATLINCSITVSKGGKTSTAEASIKCRNL